VKQFRVEFTDNKLTGNAGLVHLGRFAKNLRLQDILERHISISRGENAKYGIGDCENRGAHSHNHHHELNLGLGRISTDLGYGDSTKDV
jgi:hypothetical protein